MNTLNKEDFWILLEVQKSLTVGDVADAQTLLRHLISKIETNYKTED